MVGDKLDDHFKTTAQRHRNGRLNHHIVWMRALSSLNQFLVENWLAGPTACLIKQNFTDDAREVCICWRGSHMRMIVANMGDESGDALEPIQCGNYRKTGVEF